MTGDDRPAEGLPAAWRRALDWPEVKCVEQVDGVIRIQLHSGIELEWPDPDKPRGAVDRERWGH